MCIITRNLFDYYFNDVVSNLVFYAQLTITVLAFHDLELLRYVRIIEICLHKANVRVFHDLELLRYVLRCAIERQL